MRLLEASERDQAARLQQAPEFAEPRLKGVFGFVLVIAVESFIIIPAFYELPLSHYIRSGLLLKIFFCGLKTLLFRMCFHTWRLRLLTAWSAPIFCIHSTDRSERRCDRLELLFYPRWLSGKPLGLRCGSQ